MILVKPRLRRYYELNKNRETEGIKEWHERISLWSDIREILQRDLRKNPVVKCVFCNLFLLEEINVHKTCLEQRVSYRDSVDKDSERFVYFLYNRNMVVYVGITTNPLTRFKQHLIDKDVDGMIVIYGNISARVEALEKKYIYQWYPPLNNQLHNADGSVHLASKMMYKTMSHIEAMQEVRASAMPMLEAMECELEILKERIKYFEEVFKKPQNSP